MDAILETCAGLDVHQETVVACILKGPLDKKPTQEIITLGTTTAELLQLQDWLSERECIEVAMESTGVFWKPIWNILEDTCRLTLANPAKIKKSCVCGSSPACNVAPVFDDNESSHVSLKFLLAFFLTLS
jgi:transposase